MKKKVTSNFCMYVVGMDHYLFKSACLGLFGFALPLSLILYYYPLLPCVAAIDDDDDDGEEGLELVISYHLRTRWDKTEVGEGGWMDMM